MEAAFARRRSAVLIRLLALAGILFLSHASPPTVEAQTARLTGRVTDTQGAVLPGVRVTASPPSPAAPATAVSNDAGEYALTLAPGAYAVAFWVKHGLLETVGPVGLVERHADAAQPPSSESP